MNNTIFLKQSFKNFFTSCTKGLSPFVSDALRIACGTAIAQAIVILATPIVTRLYGPDTFGLMALFTSITGILGVIVCLRYELAIMLPKKDEEAANILALSLLATILISIMTVPIIWLGQQPLLNLIKAPGLSPYLWLVPPSVFMSGVYLALNYWNSRTRHFGRLSIARVTSTVATTGMQLGAGFSGYATGGSLIGASLVGSAVSMLMLGGQIWQDDRGVLKEHINWRSILVGLKRYKRFPIFDTWSALLNSTSWQLPIFLLSNFFSPTVVGYYALSMMVLQLPANLIGSAISQVFFQRAAEAKFDGTLSRVVEVTFLYLAKIGILPVILLAMTGKEVFIVIFGAPWAEAGVYAQVLALWIFFVFITSPISTIFSVLEKQGNFLLFNIILFGTRAGALILGGLSGDAWIALTLFALVGVIDYAGMGLWIFYTVDISILRVIKTFSKLAVYCMFVLCFFSLTKWILLSPQMITMFDILVTIPYYVLLFKKDVHILLEGDGLV